MKRVAIIGAGQLGSRHLQGLKTAQTEMEIWVIDASEESLRVAKERCDSVEGKTLKTVQYNQSIEALPNDLDLVIVATGSKPRAAIVKSLLAHTSVKYLVLEKFLFTRLQDFNDVEVLLKEKNVKCWVNCPRRMWSAYEHIVKLINRDAPIRIEYRGQNWGMCCNTVHYIDLWMYLAGNAPFMVDFCEVEPSVIESKRSGYIELLGTEKFTSADGDALILGSLAEFDGESKVIIRNEDNEIIVKESKGLWYYNGVEHTDKTPFQSGLTGILADELLSTGECRLTPYSISAQYHKPYLTAVLDFVNKIQGTDLDNCPIT